MFSRPALSAHSPCCLQGALHHPAAEEGSAPGGAPVAHRPRQRGLDSGGSPGRELQAEGQGGCRWGAGSKLCCGGEAEGCGAGLTAPPLNSKPKPAMITLSKLHPAVGHGWPPCEGIYAGPVATMITLSKPNPAVGHAWPPCEAGQVYARPFCQNGSTFMMEECSRSRLHLPAAALRTKCTNKAILLGTWAVPFPCC